MEEKITQSEIPKQRFKDREEFLLHFKKAMEGVPLDNIVLKQKPRMTKYTKEQVRQFMDNPSLYQEQLRMVVDNLCIAYPQFDILCAYLANMALINYVLIPNIEKSDKKDVVKIQKDYYKISQYIQNMNVKQEFKKAIRHNFKYDTFFGYEVETADSYFIKTLNPKYCRIYGMDDGVYLIEYDFSYFNGTNEKLIKGDELGRKAYPEEFLKLYNKYLTNKQLYQWQPLENGICTKYNETVIDYGIPPFIGLFDNLVDIEQYQALARSKAETEIWKLLSMEVPLKKDGNEDDFLLSMDTIELFNAMAQAVVPEGVGIITTPMKTQEISFNKSATSERNNVEDAIALLFDRAGFSKLLFSGAENSTALSYSVKVDEQRIFGLYRQYERIVNRKIKKLYNGRMRFKILDMSKFSEKETIDQLTKVSQASLPTKTLLVASLGIEPSEMLGLETLENEILKVSEKWLPLQSSYTQSGGEGGAPLKDDGDLGDSGIQTREIDGNKRGV